MGISDLVSLITVQKGYHDELKMRLSKLTIDYKWLVKTRDDQITGLDDTRNKV